MNQLQNTWKHKKLRRERSFSDG